MNIYIILFYIELIKIYKSKLLRYKCFSTLFIVGKNNAQKTI